MGFEGGRVSMRAGGMAELLTIEEVAERLRVSVLTVRWLRQMRGVCDRARPRERGKPSSNHVNSRLYG